MNFLKCFLKLFGVVKIELTNETMDSIGGIAIYDESDSEENKSLYGINLKIKFRLQN